MASSFLLLFAWRRPDLASIVASAILLFFALQHVQLGLAHRCRRGGGLRGEERRRGYQPRAARRRDLILSELIRVWVGVLV